MDQNSQAVLLIVHSGNARSCAMEAMILAREGSFAAAEQKLTDSDEALLAAHKIQTESLQNSFDEQNGGVNMLMAHAQDHMMTAALACDMAKEIIYLHKQLLEQKHV